MAGHHFFFAMGWSFRESIKVLPGIRLNFSRRGIGASIGSKGLHLGFGGGRRPRVTGGIGPLHYYQSFGSGRVNHQRVIPTRRRRSHFHVLTLVAFGLVSWFGWHNLSPDWKSTLLKPFAVLSSEPGGPSAPGDRAIPILPSATSVQSTASTAPEEQRGPGKEARRRKTLPHPDSSR